MNYGRQFWQALTAVALGALVSSTALAQSVTTRLVAAGGAATSTKIVPGGSTAMDVRLDIVGANVFGTAFKITQTAPASSGFLSITGRSFVGSPFDNAAFGTPDATVLSPPSNLLDPANNDNLGRPTIGFVGIAPASNVLAVNLTLTASASTPLGTYTILPVPGASFATDDQFNDYDMSTGTPFTIVVGQTLTVTRSGTGTGTVTANSGAIDCGATCVDIYPGTLVTLTAVPAAGSVFAGWTGAGCSGTGTCTVTVDAAKTVDARFDVAVVTFALSVTRSGTGSGAVTSTPAGIDCGATCSADFGSGALVTLTPAPAAGSVFAGWSGACSGVGACNVTMDAARSVNAAFNLQTFVLTVNRAGTGTGTVTSNVGAINCGAICSDTYIAGTVVMLTATPTTGVFAGWSGGGCSGTGTCLVTLNAATTVTATFAPTFSVTVTKVGSGTGTVTGTPGAINCGATCTDTFAQNAVVTLTAVPAAGSVFSGWSGGGCSGTGACTVTVSAATTVTATFTAQWVLTVTRAGAGTGTVTSNVGGINCGATCSSSPINDGTVVMLTATPAAGSVFAGWSGGGCSGTGTCAVTLTAATTVTATFAPTFSVTVTKVGSGTGTVTSTPGAINCGATCTDTFAQNAVVTLTAVPAAGSVFSGWSGGGCSGTGACTVTVSAATTVTATFTAQWVLTVTRAGAGTGTVTSNVGGINCGATCSSSPINDGTVVMLTATPAAGSVFAGWSGGGCSGTGTCAVTLTAATTVTATFTVQWVLTVTRTGTGTGTVTSNVGGIDCGATCSSSPLNDGTVVMLTATPAAGSVFAGWSGGGCSGTGTCAVTLTAATTVTATFTVQWVLTVTRTGTGTGTVTSNVGGIDCGATCSSSPLNDGTVVMLTATPAAGSVFAGWSGGGCSGTGTCAVALTAATTVTATFNAGVTLTVVKAGNGTGTVTSNVGGINCGATCSASYSSGTVVTLTATPGGAGQDFAGWSGGGCSGTGPCVVTVTAATTVTATFTSAAPPPAIPDLNQHGLTGSWYESASSGQGVEVEIFADPSSGTGSTFVSWFTFDTVIGGAERQRWYTAQGPVETGQPGAALTIYRNTGGNFNATPITDAQPVGTATLSFDTCSSGELAYQFTDGTARTGTIPLTRLTQNVTCSPTTPYPANTDFALSGNWYDPATSGQGLTVEVNPINGAFFATWYTYAPNGAGSGVAGQRWYTAQGAFAPGLRSIPVTIYDTTGGMFDTPTPPGQATVPVGTGTMAFQSCSAATFRYTFTGGTSSGLSATITLRRVGPLPPGCAT